MGFACHFLLKLEPPAYRELSIVNLQAGLKHVYTHCSNSRKYNAFMTSKSCFRFDLARTEVLKLLFRSHRGGLFESAIDSGTVRERTGSDDHVADGLYLTHASSAQ